MNQKTSLLIEGQVPEFVREEYPLFITFLEAYYEFLENKQGTNKNNLITKAKSLKTIFDVDESIDEFQENFFNTYASLIPINIQGNKELLIKNILPLYQAKGSENSFKLLFRFLFQEEPTIIFPKDSVLKASSGEWKIDNSIKVSTDVSSFYTADGNTKQFIIISQEPSANLDVYVNNILTTSGFIVLKEYNLLEFNSNLAANSTLEIFYNNFDRAIFNNRKITGKTSGATTVVEKTFSRYLNNVEILEMFVDVKTSVGNFEIGEIIESDVFVGDTLVNVRMKSVSELKEITIVNSGANYNVGDPILVTAPRSERVPQAVVSSVSKGVIDSMTILNGGAGFKVNAPITADGFGKPYVDIDVVSVLTTSSNSANVFRIFTDVISDIDPANTYINAASYGLSGIYSGNSNSVIRHTLSNASFTSIGEIIGVDINSVQVNFSSIPVFNAEAANLVIANIGFTTTNTTVYINSFGSLGKTAIRNGGTGYSIGDELVFTNPPGSFGVGAAAEVRTIGTGGTITKIEFVPTKIDGTTNVFTTNANVIGTNTFFQANLIVGDLIMVNGETKSVNTITSYTLLSVNTVFADNSTGKPVRLYGNYLIGGQGYDQNKLPTVTITSTGGSNANVEIVSIMGDSESFTANIGTNKPGSVQSVLILDAGKGLKSVPDFDLSRSGDGTAILQSSLISTVEEFPGKWVSQKGLVSSSYTKLQGKDYYIDYSYVVISSIQFEKYKQVLKELLHPAGLIAYAEVLRFNEVESDQLKVSTEISQVAA